MLKEFFSQLFRIVLGYLIALVTAVMAFILCLWLVSLAMPDSQLWSFLGLGIIAAMIFPIAFVFGVWLVIYLSWIPALAAAILTEAGRFTSPWAHIVLAVVVAIAVGLYINPDWFSEMGRNRALLSLSYLVASAVGGLVYWAIAGRRAGQWRINPSPEFPAA
jgi:glucan phosphoethanolaminetransferase (alkaline phosphatase superfamily)